MKKYFSYDENEGFVLHETADLARKQAQAGLDSERRAAHSDGEWYDEVKTICWGNITEYTAEVTAITDWIDYILRPSDKPQEQNAK